MVSWWGWGTPYCSRPFFSTQSKLHSMRWLQLRFTDKETQRGRVRGSPAWHCTRPSPEASAHALMSLGSYHSKHWVRKPESPGRKSWSAGMVPR